jgi:transposase
MRFVPVKTPEQQSVLMLHRTRQLFVRQRVTLTNAIRAQQAEFGIVAGTGRNGLEALLELIAKEGDGHHFFPYGECSASPVAILGKPGVRGQAVLPPAEMERARELRGAAHRMQPAGLDVLLGQPPRQVGGAALAEQVGQRPAA